MNILRRSRRHWSLLAVVPALLLATSCDSDSGDSSTESQNGGAPASLPDDDAPSGEPATNGGEPPSNGGEPATNGGEPPSNGGEPATNGGSPSPPSAGSGVCGAAEGQLFDSSHPWNQPIDDAPLDSESDAIIGYLAANHNSSQRFRIDGPSDYPDSLYGITVLTADGSAPREDFEETDEFYSPDCDHVPIPLPPGGAIEGETEYACDNDGDCHLIVIDEAECRLFEMWRANRGDSGFQGGCLSVWDLRQTYTETLRGDCCTSADAAGLPIAAHMFNADELAAGVIAHAIRFILPNELMRERVYVRPATHSTGATSGPDDAPPYGSRMRLRADVDQSGFSPGAQVVLRALQTYGMILSDGGNLTFTATNDRFTQAKWVDVGLGPSDLTDLEWTDFEVVELGERFRWDDSCSCDRRPLTE
jgi:hypothetical protein